MTTWFSVFQDLGGSERLRNTVAYKTFTEDWLPLLNVNENHSVFP